MTTEFQDIPLAKLDVHPRNIRRKLHDIDELADSIKSKGIVQALTVAPHPTARTRYIVLGGHRRLAAAKMAKIKTAPCMIRPDLNTPQLQTEFMLVENTQRNDLTPLEEGRAYQGLLDLPGYDAKKIAAGTGRKVRLVQERMKLARLGEKASAKLDDGVMTIEQAMVLAEFADDEATTAKLLNALGTYDWHYQSVEAQRNLAAKRAIPKTLKELEKAGVTVIPRPEGPTLGEYTWAHGNEMELSEHVAAKHVAIVDMQTRGRPMWVVLRSDVPPDEQEEAPQLSAEELVAAAEVERITAGLEVAGHVRQQHLENVLGSPPSDLARNLITPNALAQLKRFPNALGLIGLPSDAPKPDIDSALAKLTVEQLLILDNVANNWYSEEALARPDSWGPEHWGGDYIKKWRAALVSVYGYEFSAIEQEAMERIRVRNEKAAARAAAQKAERDAIPEDAFCDGCGEQLSDGQGYDGQCGDCAGMGDGDENVG